MNAQEQQNAYERQLRRAGHQPELYPRGYHARAVGMRILKACLLFILGLLIGCGAAHALVDLLMR